MVASGSGMLMDKTVWSVNVKMYCMQRDPWRKHADAAEAEPWWFRDVHLSGCQPRWTGEQNLHTLCPGSVWASHLCVSVSVLTFHDWFRLIWHVTVPPSISGETTVPREVQVTQESAVTLECQALGSPPPQISWLKNGHPLLLSPRARLLSGDSVLRSVWGLQAQSVLNITCL